MGIWPATLPQRLLRDNYEDEFSDVTIATPMDIGPPKIRRRQTMPYLTIQGATLELNEEQLATLFAFLYTDPDGAKGGAEPFTWVHPVTEVATTLFFVPPLRRQPMGGGIWRVTFGLRIDP